MKAIRKDPGEQAKVVDIQDDLKVLQEAVGGIIQGIYPFKDAVSIICNDEGKILKLPANIGLVAEKKVYDILAGTILVVGLEEDHYGDLTDELCEKMLAKLNEPTKYCACYNGALIPAVETDD